MVATRVVGRVVAGGAQVAGRADRTGGVAPTTLVPMRDAGHPRRQAHRPQRRHDENGEPGARRELGGDDVKRLMAGGAEIGDLAKELEL